MYKKISLILVTILLSGCSFSGDEINSNYFITNLTENINIDRIDGIISNNVFPILIVSSDDLRDVEIVLTDENSVETKLEYDIEKIEMEETPEYINLTLGEFDWDQYTKLITEAKNIEDEISISTFYDAGINRVKKNVDLIDSKVYFIIAYLPPIDLAKYTEIAIFDNNTLKLTQAINIESHFYENQNSIISTIISSRIGFEVPPHKQTSFDFNFMVKQKRMLRLTAFHCCVNRLVFLNCMLGFDLLIQYTSLPMLMMRLSPLIWKSRVETLLLLCQLL